MTRDRHRPRSAQEVLAALDEQPGPAHALSELQQNALAGDITARFRREQAQLHPSTPEERALFQPLDDAPGPAPTRSDLQVHTMADAIAMQMKARRYGVEPPDAQPGPAPLLAEHQTQAVARQLISRRRRRMLWQSVAASLMVASLGGAAWGGGKVWWAPPGHATSEQAPAAARKGAAPRASASASTPEEPSPEHASKAEARRDQRQPAPSPSSSRRETEAASPAKRLLHRANQERAQRHWERAEQLYVQVAREHTRRNEAYAALVAAASLRLEHTGDPEGALRFYRQALEMRPHGALSEQARYGVAGALRALGRPEAEHEALRDFLERYPDSLMSRSVRTRLESLGDGG